MILGVHFEEVPGNQRWHKKNFWKQNCVCSSTTSQKNEILLFYRAGIEEYTNFRKKKKKEKKNKTQNKSKKRTFSSQKRIGKDKKIV